MKSTNKLLLISFILISITAPSYAQEATKEKVGPCETEKQAPKPADGMAGLYEWIGENNNWEPQGTKKSGKVFVKFSVDDVGAIFDVKIAKGFDSAADKEALRLIQNMPKWIPAEESTKQCYMVLPIVFPIQNISSKGSK